MKTARLEQLLKAKKTRWHTWEVSAQFDAETSTLRIYGSCKLAFEKRIEATQVNALKEKFPKLFDKQKHIWI